MKGSPIRDYPMEGTSWIDVVDGALFDALEAEHEQLKAENDHLTERLARYEHAAICTINGWGDDGTPEVQP